MSVWEVILSVIPMVLAGAASGVMALDVMRRADRIHAKARDIQRLLADATGVEPEPEPPPPCAMPWRLRWFGWRLTVGGVLGLPAPRPPRES